MQWLVDGGWKLLLALEGVLLVPWLALGRWAALQARARTTGLLAALGALLAIGALFVGLLVASAISRENALLFQQGVQFPPKSVKDPLLWATVVGTFYVGFALVLAFAAMHAGRKQAPKT